MADHPPTQNDDAKTENADTAVWDAFSRDPSEQNAIALVEHYLPLVRRIVRKMVVYTPHYMDMDDLIQHALMGLWTAIVRFDITRGVPFEAFAGPRIRGAVRDALRRQDPLTRAERNQLKKLDQLTLEYLERFDKTPDEDVLADLAGLESEQLRSLLVRAQPWISLDAIAGDGMNSGGALAERLMDHRAADPHKETIRQEQAARFRAAFRHLPTRQQKILYLYYYEDLTLKEIGVTLDLTEARICQLHAAALLALASLLTADPAHASGDG